MVQLSVVVTLLLGLVIPHASARFGLPPRVQDYRTTTKEVDIVDGDGQKIHDILTSDRSCHLENETVIYSDGTTSTELTDHRAGVSLLLLSEEPDVCYVRDASEEPKSCLKDQVAPASDDQDPDAVTGYEAGEAMRLEDLPPLLRVRCRDRRLVALRKVEARAGLAAANWDEDEDEFDLRRGVKSILSRVGRSCKQVNVRVKVKFGCKCSRKVWGVCVSWSCYFRWEWQLRWVCC